MADDVAPEREARRVSFDALPHESWPDIAAVISGVWPRAAAEHDLRWFAAEHALRGRPLPSLRDLSARWGPEWGKDRIARMIKDESRWRDPARPWGWTATAPRQPRDTPATAARAQTPTIESSRDSDTTAPRQPRDSRAFLVEHPSPDHPITQDQHQGCEDDPTDTRKADPRSDLDTDPNLTDTPNGEPMQLFGKEIPHVADTRIAEAEPPKAPPLPSWVPKDTRPYARADVAGMVLAIVAEHRRPADLDPSAPTPEIAGDVRCKGDARTVLALWSYLERPPLGEFAADVIAVIRAAQPGGCPHRKFARDIRAENWDGGTDRHRDLNSVLVHARWEMRRAMAREWIEHPERFAAEPVRPTKLPDNRDVLSFFREPRIQ